MTVFDLLGRVPDDSRVLEFAEPLAALDAEFPGLAPKEYRGEPGRALDHIEEQLAAIVRIEEEMELVRAGGSRRWPPRLAEQPIFYPVLNEQYATKIARDWNVPASGVGYVTRFDVEADYLSQFPVRQAGGRDILEYWIPAERLEEFNDHIVGNIVEVAKFELVDGEVVERRF